MAFRPSAFLIARAVSLLPLPAPLPGSDIISLTASPVMLQTRWHELHVMIQLDQPRGICSGWFFADPTLSQDEWPKRESCRSVRFKFVEEWWGGPSYPWPYIGKYVAFVYTQTATANTTFYVQEIP